MSLLEIMYLQPTFSYLQPNYTKDNLIPLKSNSILRRIENICPQKLVHDVYSNIIAKK